MEAEKFTAIVPTLRGHLLAVASQVLADADEAKDAVQEALMRMWTVWPRIPSAADAERLAVRLTKNACIDHLRTAHNRHTASANHLDKTASIVNDTPYSLEERELREVLWQAAEHLPRREKELWHMHAEAAMGVAEIAAATGIRPRSVSAMLSTARRRIYETLKKGGYIDG